MQANCVLPANKFSTRRKNKKKLFLSRISTVVLTEFSISWRHEAGSLSVTQNSRAQLEIRRANIHGWCLRFSPGGRPSMQISKATRSQYSERIKFWIYYMLDGLYRFAVVFFIPHTILIGYFLLHHQLQVGHFRRIAPRRC